jgi:hydroxypyruvate reductase
MSQSLLADAVRIWRAGVEAVQPGRLLSETLAWEDGRLLVGEEVLFLVDYDRIAVVGAGKAARGMAEAFERLVPAAVARKKSLRGLINAPDDGRAVSGRLCVQRVRPFGSNAATPEAVVGAERIVELVRSLGPRDLCFCLLSGGASALLPLPVEGLTLSDKVEATAELSARGATIHELNAVRRELSKVKGGGLARACRAGLLVTLVVSDVLDDDLEVIGSGPTVVRPPDPAGAIAVLRKFELDSQPAGRRIVELLRNRQDGKTASRARTGEEELACRVVNLVIGNNAVAVDAAGVEAERLGYSHAMIAGRRCEGAAEDEGRRLAQLAQQMRRVDGPDCLISGGEPTVSLAPADRRGLGGRNQQLCLAALDELADWRGVALLSGGTDGEDGPTDAAGAWVDELVARSAVERKLSTQFHLETNDAYRFFEQVGGLFKTGATGTNVCDLRVLVVDRTGSR